MFCVLTTSPEIASQSQRALRLEPIDLDELFKPSMFALAGLASYNQSEVDTLVSALLRVC